MRLLIIVLRPVNIRWYQVALPWLKLSVYQLYNIP